MKLLGFFVSLNCLSPSFYISLLRHLSGSCKNAFASPKLLLDWMMGKWPRHHGRRERAKLRERVCQGLAVKRANHKAV